MGSRFRVKGQSNGNSTPPPTLHGLGPALWRLRGGLASPPIPEASWLSLQQLGLHWGEGRVLRREKQRSPQDPLVRAPDLREEIAPCLLSMPLLAPVSPHFDGDHVCLSLVKSERELQLLLLGSLHYGASGRALPSESRISLCLSLPFFWRPSAFLFPQSSSHPALGRRAQPSGSDSEKAISLAILQSCPPRNEL